MKIPEDMSNDYVDILIMEAWKAANQLSIRSGVVIAVTQKNKNGKILYEGDLKTAAEIVFEVGDKEFNSLRDARRAIQQKAFL